MGQRYDNFVDYQLFCFICQFTAGKCVAPLVLFFSIKYGIYDCFVSD